MSPEELRMNRVSLQTQWWTAVCLLLSVSWMLQQDNVCGSSSICCHCSCSSQSQFSSTQQWPAANDNTRSDCSSHTSENKDTLIIFMSMNLKHQSCFSVFCQVLQVRPLRLLWSLTLVMVGWSWNSPWSCSLTVCSKPSAGHSDTRSRDMEADRSASTSSSFRPH